MINALLFSFLMLLSQPDGISGIVTDSAGKPVASASVQIEGTELGTFTDSEGRFSISHQHGTELVLIVRHLGFREKRVEVPASTSQPMIIRLELDLVQRDEIVLTASPSGSAVAYRASSAFSLRYLQENTSDNFADMLKAEPGLSVRSFGSAPARPVIRGFDGDRVLILENGERMGDLSETAADHAISMDTDAAERIEIVRGPAGFLYGSSAMGGVINLFNQDIPVGSAPGLSGRFSSTGSSVNQGGAAFGRLQYGFRDAALNARISYRESGDIKTPSGKLSGTFNRNLNGALGGAVNRQDFNGGLAFSFLDQVYGIPEAWDVPDEDIEIRMERYNLAGNGEMKLGGWFDSARLRFNLTNYMHQEVEIELTDNLVDEEIELEFRSQSLSSSLMLIRSSQNRRISGAIGANMFLRDLQVSGGEGLTPDAVTRSVGVFGYQDHALSERLNLQAGMRLDYRNMRVRSNELFDAPDNPETSSLAFSGSVGLNIRPATGWEVGLQLARTFRAPSVEELFTDAAHLGAGAYEIGDPDLKNEIGHGVDLFTTYTRDSFGFTFSSFYYHISNYVIYQPTGEIHQPSGLPVFVYEGDNAAYMGFEADVNVVPFSGFLLGMGVDVVRANRLDADRTPLPLIPPVRYRGSVRYDTGTWYASVNARFVMKQARIAENEEATPGYTLLDLGAGYRFGSTGMHKIGLRVDNLLNTAYRDHLSRIEDRNNPMPGRGLVARYEILF